MSPAHPSDAERSGNQLTDLLEGLTGTDSTDISEVALNSVARMNDLDRLSAFVFSAWAQMRKSREVNVSMLQSVARQLGAEEEAPRHIRSTFDYLLLWAEACRYFNQNRLRFATFKDLVDHDHAVALGKVVEACGPVLSTDYGRLMFEAMLASGTARSRAARLFQSARTDSPELASALDLDHFAATYFSADAIRARASESAERLAALTGDLRYIVEPAPREQHSIQLLFSCDAAFFKIYFPYWASVAAWLRQLDVQMHFVIAAEPSEATAVVESALELLNSLGRLRGTDPRKLRDSISFSGVAVPSWVPSPKTFYACARYLLAPEIGTRFAGRILIVDIDTRMTQDPTPFLQYLRDLSPGGTALVPARGISCLIPARRFMGSTFLVPHRAEGGDSMRHVTEYMCAGLTCKTSWTLDQNALNYMVDQVAASDGPGAVVDLGQIPRPFAQEPVRRFYRAGMRRGDD